LLIGKCVHRIEIDGSQLIIEQAKTQRVVAPSVNGMKLSLYGWTEEDKSNPQNCGYIKVHSGEF
jgi:hypothetical protein